VRDIPVHVRYGVGMEIARAVQYHEYKATCQPRIANSPHIKFTLLHRVEPPYRDQLLIETADKHKLAGCQVHFVSFPPRIPPGAARTNQVDVRISYAGVLHYD
jgi:hypothetical protein